MPRYVVAERNRRGAQLSIELPPALLQRLKDRAKAEGFATAALVRRWIEACLDGALSPTRHGLSTLEVRLEALEAAVSTLQQQHPAPSPRPASEPRPKAHPVEGPTIPHLGDAPEGAITTAELATRTGTNRSGWNNWVKKAAVGDVRHHREAGSWRLVGKAPAPSGGPDRWLWEPA